MFTRVEVQNFRSLRDVSVNLSNFHVLVGANGSGKTTFLDVFAFMGDMLNQGIFGAVSARAKNFRELTSGGAGDSFFFAFESQIPQGLEMHASLARFDSVRYEIKVCWGRENQSDLTSIEGCYLFDSGKLPTDGWQGLNISILPTLKPEDSFLNNPEKFDALEIFRRGNQTLTLLRDTLELDVKLRTFTKDTLALASIEEETREFPITTWLKNQFKKYIQPISLESDAINKAGKQVRPGTVNKDGSNLPWIIESLKRAYPDRYKSWLRHVQLEFSNIKTIKTVLREDQGDMFLKIKYKEGHEFKQWMLSDGTLRYLLLTIIPYNLELKGLFLIEEPEIGLHPQAIQSVMDALRGVYEGQVFVTTHSPEAVNCAKKSELLIFFKNDAGETQIVPATEHYYFKDWKGDLGSGAFYGPGVMNSFVE